MVKKMLALPKIIVYRLNIFGIAVLAFTLPFENRYSNISLILLVVFLFLFNNFKSLQKTIYSKAWLLLVLNLLVFLTGVFLINNVAIINYTSNIGKYFLVIFIPLLIYKRVSIKSQKLILLSFCLGVIVGLLLCFIKLIFLKDGSNNYSSFTDGMGGIHPPYLSQFIVMTFFILLELFFKMKGVIHKITLVLLLIFLIYSLIYIQARMAILAFAVCLVLYTIIKTYKERNNKYIRYILLIIVSSGLLFFTIINPNDLMLIEQRLVGNLSLASNLRFNSWNCAWELFMDNSKIFGVGFSNTQILLDECYKSKYLARPYFEHHNAHNQYLQILLSSGILGIIIWLSTLVYALFTSIKNNNILGIIFLVLFMICCITEVYMVRNWGVLYFSFFYSFFVIKNYKLT